MYSGNPFAMQTMKPGVQAIMQGMGLPVNKGPINPMREPEVAGMLPAPQEPRTQYPDIGTQLNMGKNMQGLSQGGQQLGQNLMDQADTSKTQAIFNDMYNDSLANTGQPVGFGNAQSAADRAQWVQRNPLMGAIGYKTGILG